MHVDQILYVPCLSRIFMSIQILRDNGENKKKSKIHAWLPVYINTGATTCFSAFLARQSFFFFYFWFAVVVVLAPFPTPNFYSQSYTRLILFFFFLVLFFSSSSSPNINITCSFNQVITTTTYIEDGFQESI